ncbi:UNVERIFIED_CONTAM: hypothetical protein Slati_2889500 [Sesamum latifolium]|uniref:Zinc knuckle CX2CX4HX4C domain-containing protein n=1 Tax=Sesamum latifolium TaxID=2727402 RepID=A0AAW2VD77_9LAMI
MRLRVSMDITKSLKRVLKIRTVLGDEQLVSFTYEKLPNFCYLCGCLGHLSKFCELRFSDGFSDPGEATPFGPWLRATNPLSGRNRSLITARSPATPSFTSPSLNSPSPTHQPSLHRQTTKGVAIFGSITPSASPHSPSMTHSKPHASSPPMHTDPISNTVRISAPQVPAIDLPSHPIFQLETTLNSFIQTPFPPHQSLPSPHITSLSFPSSLHTPCLPDPILSRTIPHYPSAAPL